MEYRSPESLERRKIYKREAVAKRRLDTQYKEREKEQRQRKMSTPEERARRAAYKKSDKGRAAEARYRRGERGKKQYWRNHLMSRYGLTPQEEAEMLLEQDNRCALCGDLFTEERRRVIDHDHRTGKVRGLIHQKCNTLLALADDGPAMLELAMKYLLAHME